MAMEIADDEFSEEFSTFGVATDNPGVYDKLRQMCQTHRLDPESIACEWLAYSKSKKLSLQLSTDILDQFERERLIKSHSKNVTKVVHTSPFHYARDAIDDALAGDNSDDDNMVNKYCTPKSLSKKRVLADDLGSSKRMTLMSRSPGLPFSPRSLTSPATASSEKYKNRSNAGETLVSFGSGDGTAYSRLGKQSLTISDYCSEASLRECRYMFQKLCEKAHILSSQIDELGTEIQSCNSIEEFCHAGLHHQETVTIMGFIKCDENGRLNSSSVVLQGSREASSGRSIALDLSLVPKYSLFPGQRVALDGTNPVGSKFIVSKVHDGVVLPLPDKPISIQGSLTVVVACGPFTVSDNDLYEPLDDLLNYLEANPPDVCILLGPFVDSKMIDAEKLEALEVPLDVIFETKMAEIICRTQKLGIRLVVLPSQRDAHHDWVYPQPPFVFDGSSESRNVHFMPDPCTLDINGVAIGASSTDILFHLGAEEISHSHPMDRFSRLAHHLLTQQCYYPLFPAGVDVNLDTNLNDVYGQMKITPHILLLPSDLRYFVKFAGKSVCINPGRLAKGLVGGSFARICINQPKADEPLSSSIAVEILRI